MEVIEVKNGDLSFLNVGDIVWAKRYKNDLEKENIKIGHRESPYVVIKNDGKNVFVLQCTSNPHQEIEWKKLYYPLGRFNYKLSKSTYILCMFVYNLKEIQYVETIGHLSDYDLNQLKKQLTLIINSHFKIKPNIEKEYLDYKLGIGDIVLWDGYKYYIYDFDNDYLYVYRLRNYIKKNRNILINNTYYSFIFEKIEKLNINNNYLLVDTFNSGEIELINKYKEEYLNELKVSKSLRVGALIEYKNNFYYVYDLNDSFIYAYLVYTNEIKSNKLANILINGGTYKTYFCKIYIEKDKFNNNGYKVRRCALDEEIEYNNKVANLPIQNRIKERKEDILKNQTEFLPMMIIRNTNNQKYYLIISKEENVLELVNINNLSDAFYYEYDNDCPFEYYRILSKDEYDIYLKKINDIKDLVASLNI